MKLLNRLLKHTQKTESCWLWTGFVSRIGYGRMMVGGNVQQAHRVAYTLFKGAIPKNLEIDHLCNVRRCVCPEHLEAVTHAENNRRTFQRNGPATHCKRGHEFTEKRQSNGRRMCWICNKEYLRSRYLKSKGELN